MAFLNIIYLYFISICFFSNTVTAFSNSISLAKVQESSWLAEGHRLRLFSLSNYMLKDDAIMTQLASVYGIDWASVPIEEKENFKKLHPFRIFTHDFDKGELKPAYNLSQLKGIDIERLKGAEHLKALSIIKNLNQENSFLEADVHKFIFSWDAKGKVLPKPILNLREKMEELSKGVEHSIDFMDRHMASLVEENKEWGRKMSSGTEWIDNLIARMDRGVVDAHGHTREELIQFRNVSQIMENNLSFKDYKKVTKGLSVSEYKNFRSLHNTLSFSEIAKQRGLSAEIPSSIKNFVGDQGAIERTNYKSVVAKIQNYIASQKLSSVTEEAKVVAKPQGLKKAGVVILNSGKVAGTIVAKTLNVLEKTGRIAAVGQMLYGGYVFYQTGDLGAGFAASMGISDAGASDEMSLFNPSQMKLFFGLSLDKQIELIQLEPRFKSWLLFHFYSQPVETQMQLICKDDSLSGLFNLQCVDHISCNGDYPETLTTRKNSVQNQDLPDFKLEFKESPLFSLKQVSSLEVLVQNKRAEFYNLEIGQASHKVKKNLDQNKSENKKYIEMKHWILQNKSIYMRACKTKNEGILNPLKLNSDKTLNSSMQILLGFLNNQYNGSAIRSDLVSDSSHQIIENTDVNASNTKSSPTLNAR
jgi:hypothetical protein